MANTTFVNQNTVIDASWLNDVNDVSYDVLGDGTNVPSSKAVVRANLNVPQRDGTDASGTWGINISGTAAGLTSTLAVANGGTGATTAANARTNLGLVIGTDVLAPNGSGASLAGIKKVLQRVFTFVGSLGTGTSTIPWDDTIPQNTEGTQFISQSFTPTAATSTLVIEALLNLATSVDNRIIATLFQSGSVNAIAAAGHYMQTANGHAQIYLRTEMVAGGTSAITFTARAGLSAAGTVTFNGSNAARIFGGVSASWISITEIAA